MTHASMKTLKARINQDRKGSGRSAQVNVNDAGGDTSPDLPAMDPQRALHRDLR
jgi:hypothetical protein